MAREIDDRKKRKALRKLRRAADLAEQGLGPPLSDWERTFLEELEARIETYGSAFADPSKGDLDEPLSALQAHKLKEIDKKARGKGRSLQRGKQKKTGSNSSAKRPKKAVPRRISDLAAVKTRIERETPTANDSPDRPPDATPPARPRFQVIEGGKSDD